MNTTSPSAPRPRSHWLSKFKLFASMIMLAWLAACGGGGGGGSAPFADAPASAASVAQQCVTPRTGTDTRDTQGSIASEKLWVRAHMDETYLWYKDVPAVNAETYIPEAYSNSVFSALSAYFRALKTPKRTDSNKLVDEFSFATRTADLVNQQAGISSGYGIRFGRVSSAPSTSVLRVLYVEPNSPAALAGIQRGDTVKSVDGVDINDTTVAGRTTLNAGLNPAATVKTTIFGLLGVNASVTRNVTVVSSTTVAVTPVPTSKTFSVGTSTVGYLVLNSFNVTSAQKQLIEAVTQLKSAAVNELVLDLRYNGGGFLAISNQLSWMIGDASLADKVYEKNICNDKNPFALCNTADKFRQLTIGDPPNNVAADQTLPQLGLKRVFVLTSSSTCSASESLINGLSPFLKVIRIGNTTCGKPYGFFIKDNCGTSYGAIQFKGANANDFGDFADGFAPTCTVGDDLSKERGDAAELMLAGAMTYIKTGSCPAVTPAGVQKLNVLGEGDYKVIRSPIEESRILNLPASPL